MPITKRTTAKQANTKLKAEMTPEAAFQRGREVLARQAPPEPATEKLPVQQISKLVEGIRQLAKEELESRFESFLDEAKPEEIRFMSAVMMDFDGNNYGNKAESPVERTLPILNAIQHQLDELILIQIPDSSMVRDVEHFIVELGRRSHDRRLRHADLTDEERREKLAAERLQVELDVFRMEAGTQSIKYMRRLLARWGELHRNPVISLALNAGGKDNLLMAAAEIESGSMQAEEVVDRLLAAAQ